MLGGLAWSVWRVAAVAWYCQSPSGTMGAGASTERIGGFVLTGLACRSGLFDWVIVCVGQWVGLLVGWQAGGLSG